MEKEIPKTIKIKIYGSSFFEIPNTKKGIAFKGGYEKKGRACHAMVINPKQLLDATLEEFSEVLRELNDVKLEKMRTIVIGPSEKAWEFRELIENEISLRAKGA